MKRLIPTLAAASFAVFASFAFAQGTPGYGPGMGGQGMGPGGMQGPGMQGQAGRGEMREKMRAAYEACKDKPDQRACMTEQYCAKSPDPAKCQAQAKEHAQLGQKRLEERQKMAEACNGKRGDDLTKCVQTQHQAKRNQYMEERQKAHEACTGKRGDELGNCLKEQREKFGHQMHGQKG
jgi:Spy/CpxP family protein refolding chaperone